MSKSYPQSFRDRAVRMVTDRLEEENAPSQYVVMNEVAPKLGVATETLRRWCVKGEVAAGKRAGVATGESQELRRLKRENAELRRANEILKTASGFCQSAELNRP